MRERGTRTHRGVIVRDGDHGLPYSKGLTANTVIASGLSPARAYQVAQAIEDRLIATGKESVDIGELRRLTIDAIRTEAGDRYAAAYEKWISVGNLDIPLIILIGGGTGVGKSTIATQLAARLGIVRVISTDAIREVMKGTFSKEFMPTLYTSSFDTAEVVKVKSTRADDAVLVGFRDQVSAVSVGINALIERAVNEGTDVIIEGAHVVPGFINPEGFTKKAVIVWIVIQVEDEALHKSHFFVRAHETRSRPVERYLAHFQNIRKIQKYIKSLALQHGVPIISNYNLDAAIGSVIEHVIDSAVEAAKGRPQRKMRAIRGGSR
ncbi:MAG: 2-phosphoglycerate kinase [Actinomycetota bacterium]